MNNEKQDNMANIPYIAFEATQARSERHIKRLIVALIISIVITFATNLAWLYTWNQYDYESESVTRTFVQDGSGLNIIGDSNEVENGSNSKLHEKAQNEN